MKKLIILACMLIILSTNHAYANSSYFTSDNNDFSLENGKWWVTMDSVSKIFCIRCMITGLNFGSASACQQIAIENPGLSGLDKTHEKVLHQLIPECGIEKIVSYIDKVYEYIPNRVIPVFDIMVIMAKEQEGKFDETKRAEVFKSLVSKYEKAQKTLK